MLNFTLNEPVEVSFKVGIAGSGAVPQRVTVVLKQADDSGLTFEAHSPSEGVWAANVNVPLGALTEGPAQLAIEVLLNNKLFVPVRETVEIVAPAELRLPAPAAPTVEPEVQATVELAEPVKPAPPPAAPVTAEDKAGPIKVSALLKETEQKAHKRKVSKREVTKIFEGVGPKAAVDAARRKLAEANKRLERKPFEKLVEGGHPPVQVQVTSQPAFHIKKTKVVTR